MERWSGKWKLLVGVSCIVAGLWTLSLAAINTLSPVLSAQKVTELKAGEPRFTAVRGHYQTERIERYKLQQGDSASLPLDIVSYHASDGSAHRAILYHADNISSAATDNMALRQQLWIDAMAAVNQHTDEQTLFLSWWDDAQRIDWFSGRNTWATAPAAAAFANDGEKDLWAQLAGPLAQDDTRLRQLARWLVMDAHEALTEMSTALPDDKATSVYFLACLDDLARLGEIERLSGKKLAFATALFPRARDTHAQIAEVKRWAHEKGNGSYLLQNTPAGIRAWRMENAETENTLLAKLLPFTSSLENPLAELEMVYQSPWAAYLTVFRWNR
jgi:hydroxylamine oxidation protein HaoB